MVLYLFDAWCSTMTQTQHFLHKGHHGNHARRNKQHLLPWRFAVPLTVVMVNIAGVVVLVDAHTIYTLVIGINHVLESFLKLTTNPHLLPHTGYSTEFIPGMAAGWTSGRWTSSLSWQLDQNTSYNQILIIYSLILHKLTKIWSNAHYNNYSEKLKKLEIHI